MDRRSALRERIRRERQAHDVDDVLAESWRLKRLFCHTVTSPTARRLEATLSNYVALTRGKDVLDMGCGRGESSRLLRRQGARVVGCDISQRYVNEAALQCRAEGLDGVSFLVADAHQLSFRDGSFDFIMGRGILHHLDLERALAELWRVLKPGGRAVFQEPLAGNPLLRLFRVLTPRARTRDETPLTRSDLELIEGSWHTANTYYGIVAAPVAAVTSILCRPYSNNVLLRIADAIDRWLSKKAPWKYSCQYVILDLRKPVFNERRLKSNGDG